MSSAAPGKDNGHKNQSISELAPQTAELIQQILWRTSRGERESCGERSVHKQNQNVRAKYIARLRNLYFRSSILFFSFSSFLSDPPYLPRDRG